MSKKEKKEVDSILKDIEKNIKDKNEAKYLKQAFEEILDKMDKMEERISKKEKQANKKLKIAENILNHVEGIIYNTFYADEEDDEEEDDGFMIECPFCENTFILDVDEMGEKIKCPICNKEIELDWSGEVDDWEIVDYENNNCKHNCKDCGKHGPLSLDEIRKILDKLYEEDDDEED